MNIGWNAGLIDGKRPFFCECWADGCTVITYFISTKGIEDYTVGQLEEMLSNADIISYNCQEHYEASAMTFTDHSGNEFYSVNMVVGDEEKTYTDGGMIFSFSYLNKFNQKRNEAFEEEYNAFLGERTGNLNEEEWATIHVERNEQILTSTFFTIYGSLFQ